MVPPPLVLRTFAACSAVWLDVEADKTRARVVVVAIFSEVDVSPIDGCPWS
jgi:hypothetical protein